MKHSLVKWVGALMLVYSVQFGVVSIVFAEDPGEETGDGGRSVGAGMGFGFEGGGVPEGSGMGVAGMDGKSPGGGFNDASNAGQGAYDGSSFSGSSAERGCNLISAQMAKGARDISTSPRGQVSVLQAFLARRYNIPMDQILTGYFGDLTHTTVVRFQNDMRIAPAEGVVGPLTRSIIARECQVLMADEGIARWINHDVITGKKGSLSAKGCTIPQGGSCSLEVEWISTGLNAEKVDVRLVPPGGAEYSWSQSVYPAGAPSALKTPVSQIMIPGLWQVRLYEYGTGKLLDSLEVSVVSSASGASGLGNSATSEGAVSASGVGGTLTAKACGVGQRSAIASDNTLVCDSSVSWTTTSAMNAYVVITGDFPYNRAYFPYGFLIQPGLQGQNKTFWTVSGTYMASLYVNGVWPTKESPGTGTKIREATFVVGQALR